MKQLGNDRGAVLVFITLMIILLMIMVGLGLDTGTLTYSRSQGQSAVDAAALSAVSGLPTRVPAQVEARATSFINTNDYTGSTANPITAANVSYVKYNSDPTSPSYGTITYGEPIATANGVRVALEDASGVNTPMFLTPLFNLFGASAAGTQKVNVSAVATIASKPAIPIALWSNLCGATDQEVIREIKMQHPDKTDDDGSENSCWTTFLDCSSGARDIKDLFDVAETCSGAKNETGSIEIGTPICQNRGQVNSALNTADKFFTQDHANSWWLVPVIGGGGNCDPTNPTVVTNWAKIYPTGVSEKGNPKTISAKIVCNPNFRREVIDTNICQTHRLVRERAKGM